MYIYIACTSAPGRPSDWRPRTAAGRRRRHPRCRCPAWGGGNISNAPKGNGIGAQGS